MKSETIAIHGGYEVDPTTKAVAVPIYQTVAYAFDSADHGAALFNLEVDGFRYSRISNPTTAVLERRVAALEGGVEALCVSSGQAALNYAVLNVSELGCNIVSVPQLYGTTYTLFDLQPAGRVVSRPGLRRSFQRSRVHRALPQCLPADDGFRAAAPECFFAAAGHRNGGAARRAPRGERPSRRGIPARGSPGRLGELRGIPREPLSRARATIPRRPRLLPHDLRNQGRVRGRQEVLRRPRARQAARQHG